MVGRMARPANGKEAGGYDWKIGNLRSVAVAPDGSRMAAGSDTGKVVVWDAED